jgi:hypothetical protein
MWDVTLIDASLPDARQLAAAAATSDHVLFYDGTRDRAADVLGRVASLAAEHGKQIRSLSLLSHGAAGQFALGTDVISTRTLAATADAWRRLGSVFADGANLYLYGCNTARTPAGGALLDRLATLTGTDVFGSTDLTGRGGDWALEAASRGAAAELTRIAPVLQQRTLANYAGTLAANEVLVNTNTTGSQQLSGSGPQAIGMAASGAYASVS